MKKIREPVVAGTWYPGTEAGLKSAINEYLDNVKKARLNGAIKAIIVPHAGYRASGQVAAVAFNQLDDIYDTVILLGPSHGYPLYGASILNVTHYKTPLGEVPLSKKVKALLEEDIIKTIPEAHSEEHSLEIELPFLQQALAKFELIPILVGNIDPGSFQEVLLKHIDDKTLIVVSVDLSHYHPYDEAKQLDSYSIGRILGLDSDGIFNAEIDAPWAVSTLINIAKEKNWKPVLLYYANSGDTLGDKSAVVGYSAIAFVESSAKEKEEKEPLTKEEQKFLLKLARDTLESYLKTGKKPDIGKTKLTPALKQVQGCFTTLNKNHDLRGCIGHILPQEELYKCVMDNAISAALHDPRFEPVKYDELKDIKIEISALTVPKKLSFSSGEDLKKKLRPMVDGVVLKQGWRQSTYLPQVWEQLPDKEEFLSSLCTKGGMKPDCWEDTKTEVQTYQAFVFEEDKD
ncbi:AmmeMemoRadiSam system protein B [Candidatus Woesearchaeota archaeon]|nr:AmmeMemoRadiSam system protein B [Candidatus Woesearchaeota archaeon]